jgi:hypothetical protein
MKFEIEIDRKLGDFIESHKAEFEAILAADIKGQIERRVETEFEAAEGEVSATQCIPRGLIWK